MTEQKPPETGKDLNILIRLTALALTDGKSRSEQVFLLSKAKLQPKEIAELLDTSPNAISVELARIRKHGVRRPKSGADH